MTDQTTNPVGESSLTVDQAAEAILKLSTKKDSKEQPSESKVEESESENAEPKVEASAEDSSKEEQPKAEDKAEGESEETILLIDDEEVPVSKLKEWKESGLRQADYTQKTQALAQERKAWEEQRAAEEAKFRAEWTNKLAMFGGQVANELQEFAAIDWDTLRNEDPFTYQTKYTDYLRAQERANRASQVMQQEIEAEKAKLTQVHQKNLEEQAKIAVQLIPELADPTKAQALITEMTDYMKSVRFTPEEIASITDGRALAIIRDAMSYRKLKSTGNEVVQKKVVPQTKVLKSGSTATKATATEREINARKEQFSRLKKTGSIDDAAALFYNQIKRK